MTRRYAIVLASSIYIFWGLTPIYWKFLRHVSPFELLANRILWGLIFVTPFLLGRERRLELKRLLSSERKTWVYLLAASVLIGLNWYNFVLAMVTNRVLESSLAYFLTPLMVVLVGVCLLQEKLTISQKTSLGLAATGMVFLLFYLGKPPWLALLLSSSFAIYGYFKTRVGFTAKLSVGIEHAILAVPAAIFLWRVSPHYDLRTWILLSMSGPLTIIPMIVYSSVVKAIPYSTVGFLQYISPGFQFFLAVAVYHETFSFGHQVAFGFTWLALIVFTHDLFRRLRCPSTFQLKR